MIRKKNAKFCSFFMIGGASWYLYVEHTLEKVLKSD